MMSSQVDGPSSLAVAFDHLSQPPVAAALVVELVVELDVHVLVVTVAEQGIG